MCFFQNYQPNDGGYLPIEVEGRKEGMNERRNEDKSEWLSDWAYMYIDYDNRVINKNIINSGKNSAKGNKGTNYKVKIVNCCYDLYIF